MSNQEMPSACSDRPLGACTECQGAPYYSHDTGTGLSHIFCAGCGRYTSLADLSAGPSGELALIGEWENWPSPAPCPCCGSSVNWTGDSTSAHLSCAGCGLRSREASGHDGAHAVLLAWNGGRSMHTPILAVTIYTSPGREPRVHTDVDPNRDAVARQWGWEVEQVGLYRATCQPAIPADTVVMPITPTQEMLGAVRMRSTSGGTPTQDSDILQTYRALVSAAPRVYPHPVWDGRGLPPVGARVLIHLGREDAWVEHVVTGYYVWDDLNGRATVKRVFVNVVDSRGYPNSRLLSDVRPLDYQQGEA